ncbi:MAG: hypothetical protein H6620_11290 [Halobacteriovoraceae bacterium]|nr:hypothetical protein [Halobacteriovoraceae bacterium]
MLNTTVYYSFFFPTLLLIWGLYLGMNALKKRKVSKLEHWTCVIFLAIIAPIPFLITNYFLKAGWVEDPTRFLIHHLMWYLAPLALVATSWIKQRNEEKKTLGNAPIASDRQKKG